MQDDGYQSKADQGIAIVFEFSGNWARWFWVAQGSCHESWTDAVMKETSALGTKAQCLNSLVGMKCLQVWEMWTKT